MGIRVCLADMDEDFRRRFACYLSEKADDVSIRTLDFSNENSGETEAGMMMHYDLIIADEAVLGKVIDRLTDGVMDESSENAIMDEAFIYEKTRKLCENSDTAVIVFTGFRSRSGMPVRNRFKVVYKYQSAGNIMREIADVVSFENSDSLESFDISGKRKMKRILIGGAYGGCGKTAISVSAGRELEQLYGKRVLYMSAGAFSDIEEFADSAEKYSDKNVSDENCGLGEKSGLEMLLMNYMGGRKTEAGKFISEDSSGMCFPACAEDAEKLLGELSEDEVNGFLDYIEQWNMFDYLILDTCCDSEMLRPGILKKMDIIIMVRDLRRKCRKKENRWYMKIEKNFSGFSPVFADNFAETCDEMKIFFTENDIEADESGSKNKSDCEPQDTIQFFYDPECFTWNNGHVNIDTSGRFGSCVGELCRIIIENG